MRADLAWSYLTAGAMNTANAAGYLAGALAMPRLLPRVEARRLLLAGGLLAALLMAAHAVTRGDWALLLLRAATGAASAASFVPGGLLAARLAGAARALSPGLVLGLYYGGTGLGIIASTLLVPPLPWREAWGALDGACALATLATAAGTRTLHLAAGTGTQRSAVPVAALAFGLAGYLMFGLGYIGYMTFVITLLREQGLSEGGRMGFDALLGTGVVASSWLWSGLLQRWRGGQTLALLNALLAAATLIPVWSREPLWVYASRRARPWYAMSLLTAKVAPGPSPTMDEALTRRACALHHPIDALETWRAQLTTVADAVTIADLQDALRARATMRCDLDAMKQSYVAGIAARMARHLNGAGAGRLLHDRNAAWLPTIEGYLAADGAFVAVGSSHLHGDDGLPAQLAARGYTVERQRW